MMVLHSSEPRKHILVAFVIFFIFLGLTVPLIVTYSQINNSVTQQVLTREKTLTDITASALKIKLDHLVGIATSMAQDENFSQAVASKQWDKAAGISRDLQNDVTFYDTYIDRMLVVDTTGTIQAAYPQLVGGVGQSASSSDWFMNVSKGAPYFVSRATKRNSIPRIKVINLGVPVLFDGKVVGYFALQLSTESFLEFGDNVSIGIYGFAYIVDQQGNLVAHPKSSAQDGTIVSFAQVPEVEKALAGQGGTDIVADANSNEKSLVTYQAVPVYNWGVVTQQPYQEAFVIRDEILSTLSWEIVIALIANLLISYGVFAVLESKRKKDKRRNAKK